MHISLRIQPNCSEWNEEVTDEEYDPLQDLRIQLALQEAKKKARDILKDWD